MYIIGISALDKDSSVTLFHHNIPVYCVSEERLTRTKMQDGFPWKTMEEVCNLYQLKADDIAGVAYPFYNAEKEFFLGLKNGLIVLWNILKNKNISIKEKFLSISFLPKALKDNFVCHKFCDKELKKGLKHWNLYSKLSRFHHALSHAASVYYSSESKEALIQIADWYGSGTSGGIFLGKEDEIKPLVYYIWPNSMGSFYARYTIALGFTPDRHEGKVMGLAAHGDPAKAFLDFQNEFEIKQNGAFFQKNCLYHNTKKIIEGLSAEDIAASTQDTFESVLISSLIQARIKNEADEICLAGGSMANVKYNQIVSELEGIKKVTVFPAMTDTGTGYGAACLLLKKLGKKPHHTLHHVYLSAPFSKNQIEAAIKKSGLPYFKPDDFEDTVSEYLAKHKIVGLFNGKMEFGPRALGNRSVLANPSDKKISIKLNEILQRTEFMPFAPSTTVEIAKDNLPNFQKNFLALKFMAITVNLPHNWTDQIPAAVHIDNTTRIHTVSEDTNAVFHRIIDLFYKKTGIPAVLNTSFNIHEEPIVYSPLDAIGVFKKAKFDYLAINPYIVSL